MKNHLSPSLPDADMPHLGQIADSGRCNPDFGLSIQPNTGRWPAGVSFSILVKI
jgi:hypothetical protein